MSYTVNVTPACGMAKIVVGADCDIKEAIVSALLSLGWKRAAIVSAVGSVKNVTFTTVIQNTLPLVTKQTNYPDAYEMVSFTGEVTAIEDMDPALKSIYKDDCPLFVHIHASCALRDGQVVGGGFKGGKTLRSLTVYVMHEAE